MAAYSKLLTCYELGHTWTPYCTKASLDIAKVIYVESFKIYGSLYLISAILQRRKLLYYTQTLLPSILKSTFFLGSNGTIFMAMFCIWRKILGRFYFLSAGFLPAICASFLSILCERKSRRGMLALYVTNLSIETLFNSAVSRGLITPIPHGEVLLFSLAVGCFAYLFKSTTSENDPIRNGLSFLLGPSEIPPSTAKELKKSSTSEKDSTTDKPKDVKSRASSVPLPAFLSQILKRLRDGPKHSTCKHPNACAFSTLKAALRMFSGGVLVETLMRLASRFTLLKKQPGKIFNTLFTRDNTRLGAFLGLFVGVFKAVSCSMRWARGADSPIHGLLAGLCAGPSMLFYPSSSIALYLASKLCESLYFQGIKAGVTPHIKCADIIIYTFSTSVLLHSVVIEPHNIRPAYWRFVLRITGDRFGQVNRKLLDVFGYETSTLYKDFWPAYDQRFTKLTNSMPEIFKNS